MTRPDTREDILTLAETFIQQTDAIEHDEANGRDPGQKYEFRASTRVKLTLALLRSRAAPTPPAAEAPIPWSQTSYGIRGSLGLPLTPPPAAEAPGQEPVAVPRWAIDLAATVIAAHAPDEKSLLTALVSAPTKQEPVAELLPIYLPGGFGDRISAAMTAYLADYAYDQNPDQGFADHELTEFERGMMEDFLAGAISDEGVNAILQEAARAMAAPPTYADAEAKGFERGIEAAADAVKKAGERVGNLETPAMRGDNLAICLCTHFDDGGDNDGDTGWSAAATGGYDEVMKSIRDHYAAAIRSLASPAPKGET